MLEKNNQVIIIGNLADEIRYSHTSFEIPFYMSSINTQRLSGASDIIPIIINEAQADTINRNRNYTFCIRGELNSHVNRETRKLLLFIFVKKVEVLYESGDIIEHNEVILEGNLCKEPQFRITPLGRKITDMFLVVNHKNGKSNFIPCICWNKAALNARNLHVGELIRISGRIQSREYRKVVSENRVERRTAIEVSINRIESGITRYTENTAVRRE